MGDRGSPPTNQVPKKHSCHVTSTNLDKQLTKFWEIEEASVLKQTNQEDMECENHFKENVTRDENGRYMVALPFNHLKSKLGESKTMAMRRLQGMQRKLEKDPTLEKAYNEIMQEYINLGHMTEIAEEQIEEKGFYLPHHAVHKLDSLTTKIRIVFDGSAKTSTGISLNNALRVGPTLGTDLLSLLLRFRIYTYVITADLEKMFRQFLVRPEDRQYLRILWARLGETIKTFVLNTVTFGLGPSSFLSVRCLHQLAEDEQHRYPEAAKILIQDTYVDNILTGVNTINEAIYLRDQIIAIFKSACLNIRQWASNDPEIVRDLPRELINEKLQLGDDSPLKTLGLLWDSMNDTIVYTMNFMKFEPTTPKITKRTVLSQIAKIYDPLGLLGPIVIIGKIFIQRLWSAKLHWDESLKADLQTEWTTYCKQFNELDQVSFHRLAVIPEATNIQIHGFCDASEKAYGACLFLRSVGKDGKIHVQLLCSKSRVAPLKGITIRKLELCGAALLSDLLKTVREAIKLQVNSIYLWSDSTIVLHWLRTPPHQLKVFEANRVSKIQATTNTEDWYHVRSHDNPADVLSRGLFPAEFKRATIWCSGPYWLSHEQSVWPIMDLPTVQKNNVYKDLITVPEILAATTTIIKILQQLFFQQDIENLTKQKTLSYTSKLSPLNPFLDEEGVLRVGDRLTNSNLPFKQKHPILLPKSHHVTRLIIEDAHRTHQHAGTQATLYALRRRYWIIDGRSTVRKVVRSCVICRRMNPPTIEYIMGNLPKARVTQSRPFSKVGIDYCGPFFIKEKKFRNQKRIKVYIAVFVCLAVKAVHLEVVSDLTTVAFIAALRRFVGRRGLCTDIYTDNGTNFVGADRELAELATLFNSPQHQQEVSMFLTKREIKWHFIPARAPNFGGLWEAAVKSFKHHFKRVVGDELFTFEELNTFAVEIEAVLNSRPITPISSDPNDLLVLTPGHFLIGDSLTSLPEQDYREVPDNRLSAWEHIQKVKQHFWSRWHQEYINELTIRHKWTKGVPEIREGSIVLIKEDNLPPLHWAMGRVIKLHPGKDGINRVASVKTSTSVLDRSVKKLAPLPMNENCETDDKHNHSVNVDQ